MFFREVEQNKIKFWLRRPEANTTQRFRLRRFSAVGSLQAPNGSVWLDKYIKLILCPRGLGSLIQYMESDVAFYGIGEDAARAEAKVIFPVGLAGEIRIVELEVLSAGSG